MSSPTKTAPLGERDINAPVSPKKLFSEKNSGGHGLKDTSKPAPGFSKSNVASLSATGTYISPSDAIMSPASQKLAGMKGRRFASAKPKSLFAKTVLNEHNTSITATQGNNKANHDGLKMEETDKEELDKEKADEQQPEKNPFDVDASG